MKKTAFAGTGVKTVSSTKKIIISKCYFLQKAHSCVQTPVKKVFLSGNQYSVESTKSIRIKYLTQRHTMLTQLRTEPTLPHHLTHDTLPNDQPP